MSTRSPKRVAILISLAALCLCWWWMSWDFGDQFVAGKYVAVSHGERNVLILDKDHRFAQEIWKGDRTALRASGTWRRFGKAGIAFSNNLMEASPAAITDSNVYGMLDNNFGLWTLTLDSNDRWKFHKLWFL